MGFLDLFFGVVGYHVEEAELKLMRMNLAETTERLHNLDSKAVEEAQCVPWKDDAFVLADVPWGSIIRSSKRILASERDRKATKLWQLPSASCMRDDGSCMELRCGVLARAVRRSNVDCRTVGGVLETNMKMCRAVVDMMARLTPLLMRIAAYETHTKEPPG